MDVTVITPTVKGREAQLAECMATVAMQTVAVKHAIELDTKGIGAAAMRNKLVKEADTTWVAFADDDCLLEQDHIETLLAHSDLVSVVYSLPVVADPAVKVSHFCKLDKLREFNWIPVTVLCRRSSFLQVGGFDDGEESLWGLWLKMLDADMRFKCVHKFTWVQR